jgi:2-keto-4-pentenoate hydratase/2-oxohepta-3-ene-1,7-dioic acid hydratase in catechol pathway
LEALVNFFAFKQNDQDAIGLSTTDGDYNFSEALEVYQRSQGNKQPVPVPFLQLLVEMGFCTKEATDEVMGNAWVQSKLGELRISSRMPREIPISRPSKVIGIGRNYVAHAEELNHNVPDTLIFFAKATSSLLAHEQSIIIPKWVEGRVDHEAELGVIIGTTCHNVSEKEALNHVAGYTIINDVTARDMQRADMENAQPWYRSKAIDTFCPIGPGITPADAIKDIQNLDIHLTVNGETRQKTNTGKMIFPVRQIIAELSKFMTLMPGDIIATGTPEGVGAIKAGDNIEITISEVGTLRNTVAF